MTVGVLVGMTVGVLVGMTVGVLVDVAVGSLVGVLVDVAVGVSVTGVTVSLVGSAASCWACARIGVITLKRAATTRSTIIPATIHRRVVMGNPFTRPKSQA